jgi:hypothetical protein
VARALARTDNAGALSNGWSAAAGPISPVMCSNPDAASLHSTAARMQALLIAGQKADALKYARCPLVTSQVFSFSPLWCVQDA